MLRLRRILFAFLFLHCLTDQLIAEQGLNVLLHGERQTILPLGFDTRNVVALTRNGFLLNLKQRDLKEPQVVPQFQAFSQQEMRAELLHEYGRHFEVTGTGNYLVVHPQGARDLWANRFENLYRSMVHFFRTRGFSMEKSKYPLVGIVFYSQRQYVEYCRRALKTNVDGSCGVYLTRTNRIYLYDDTKGTGTSSPRWEENLATIMHEAAHQTAFNCGIHQRAGETPAWIVEGLGCLFEGKGIYDSAKFRRTEHRINYGRLHAFKKRVRQDAAPTISALIAADSLFRRDQGRAYATAWALTFYLSEREPQKYARYLKTVAQHKPLTSYPASLRVQDFQKVFGQDYDMLAVRLIRYMDDLPPPIRDR